MPLVSGASLTYLGFELVPSAPFVRPYVRNYWSFRRETVLPERYEAMMHPTGGFGLVFNFGDLVDLDGHLVTSPVFLDGSNTRSRKMGFHGRADVMGIRFYEGGAFPFLRVPLIELKNELDVLAALGDGALLRLHSRMAEATTMLARISLLEAWLAEQLSAGLERSGLIPASLTRLRKEVDLVWRGYQRSSITTLTKELAISQRQLEHLYRSYVGMTPMEYLRLQRVERARVTLSQEKVSNTHLAAALGYYDQAHFTHEFREIVGVTPYAYMRRKQDDRARE